MKIDNIDKFYEEHHGVLLGEDGLRPAKSITRNIHTSFDKFKKFYRETKLLSFDQKVLENRILGTHSPSTVADNIKNMEQFGLIIEIEDGFKFTKRFKEMCDSGKNIEAFILSLLKNVYSIRDLNMVLNLIICTLRDGVINEKVILFPDSLSKFESNVPVFEDRVKYCKMVFDIYGFKSRTGMHFGEYTPNANYRIISTMVDIGLIVRSSYIMGMQTYSLTDLAFDVLSVINKNLGHVKTIQQEKEVYNDDELIEMLEDERYQKELTDSEEHLDMINRQEVDLPEPTLNKIHTSGSIYYKRDARRANNAKQISGFQCEINKDHKTFTSNSTLNQYVEAHHLIPISLQSKFYYSLDVEANIVALCPICHRKIHYGIKEEKREILLKLYKDRKDRLSECYLNIKFEDLLKEY